jgi:Raf kinase inhibitor-like YbhB/YbcL family protein
MNLRVRSPAFAHGAPIPAIYTCDGRNISPPLEWDRGPIATESYALIMDDPDAPGGTWVHWVAWNITATQLPEGVSEQVTDAPMSTLSHGTNSWDSIGYGGPCPPSGTHRYFFKVYALNCELVLGPDTTKPALLVAMEGRILDRGELMGTYTRQKK